MGVLKTVFFMKNVPPWERALRVLTGLVLGVLASLWAASPWNWLGAVAGLETALTGFIGFCPMCALAGRRIDKAKLGSIS